jgi:hypothetical protein
VYFAFLNQLARTNNWVCKTCGTGTQKVNTAAPVDIGLIAPGFGQCSESRAPRTGALVPQSAPLGRALVDG